MVGVGMIACFAVALCMTGGVGFFLIAAVITETCFSNGLKCIHSRAGSERVKLLKC